MGPDRLRAEDNPHSPSEERDGIDALPEQQRTASPAAATAGEPAWAPCRRLRARRAGHNGMVSQDDGKARRASPDALPDPPPHAPAQLRLSVCQPGEGYPEPSGLPRAPQYPEHGP